MRSGQTADAHEPVVRVNPLVQTFELVDQFTIQSIDLVELEYHTVDELLFEQRPDLLGEARCTVASGHAFVATE